MSNNSRFFCWSSMFAFFFWAVNLDIHSLQHLHIDTSTTFTRYQSDYIQHALFSVFNYVDERWYRILKYLRFSLTVQIWHLSWCGAKMEFSHGKIETKMNLPFLNVCWPILWMFSSELHLVRLFDNRMQT